MFVLKLLTRVIGKKSIVRYSFKCSPFDGCLSLLLSSSYLLCFLVVLPLPTLACTLSSPPLCSIVDPPECLTWVAYFQMMSNRRWRAFFLKKLYVLGSPFAWLGLLQALHVGMALCPLVFLCYDTVSIILFILGLLTSHLKRHRKCQSKMNTYVINASYYVHYQGIPCVCGPQLHCMQSNNYTMSPLCCSWRSIQSILMIPLLYLQVCHDKWEKNLIWVFPKLENVWEILALYFCEGVNLELIFNLPTKIISQYLLRQLYG